MQRCLAVDVLGVDIDFLVTEERDGIVHVTMRDGVVHDVAAHLFNRAYHIFN